MVAGLRHERGGSALINERTEATVATSVMIAATRQTRRRGLLGRDGLEPGEALILAPCFAVHTAFMRFAIDVIFLDPTGRIVRIVRDLVPWRMAAARRARAVVELSSGALGGLEIAEGDRLYLAPLR